MKKYAVVAVTVALTMLFGMSNASAKDVPLQIDVLTIPEQGIANWWCSETPSGLWKCCGEDEHKKISICEIRVGKSEP